MSKCSSKRIISEKKRTFGRLILIFQICCTYMKLFDWQNWDNKDTRATLISLVLFWLKQWPYDIFSFTLILINFRFSKKYQSKRKIIIYVQITFPKLSKKIVTDRLGLTHELPPLQLCNHNWERKERGVYIFSLCLKLNY